MIAQEILASTSQNPSGPWSKSVVLYTGNTILYAPTAQPHFDDSGKTLVFDVSIFSPIYLQTIKIVSDSLSGQQILTHKNVYLDFQLILVTNENPKMGWCIKFCAHFNTEIEMFFIPSCAEFSEGDSQRFVHIGAG